MNIIANKISWLGYEFARSIFPDKFPDQPHYSSYSEMVQQEQERKEINDRIFAKKYIQILSSGSVQLQMGNYLTNQDIEEEIAEIAKYDFKNEL